MICWNVGAWVAEAWAVDEGTAFRAVAGCAILPCGPAHPSPESRSRGESDEERRQHDRRNVTRAQIRRFAVVAANADFEHSGREPRELGDHAAVGADRRRDAGVG